jgi:hypothetical protein
MIWTVIGYKDGKSVVHTFHGSQNGKDSISDAYKVFPGIEVVAIVAGNHLSSTYLKEKK